MTRSFRSVDGQARISHLASLFEFNFRTAAARPSSPWPCSSARLAEQFPACGCTSSGGAGRGATRAAATGRRPSQPTRGWALRVGPSNRRAPRLSARGSAGAASAPRAAAWPPPHSHARPRVVQRSSQSAATPVPAAAGGGGVNRREASTGNQGWARQMFQGGRRSNQQRLGGTSTRRAR